MAEAAAIRVKIEVIEYWKCILDLDARGACDSEGIYT